jgi:hypothetical protein
MEMDLSLCNFFVVKQRFFKMLDQGQNDYYEKNICFLIVQLDFYRLQEK